MSIKLNSKEKSLQRLFLDVASFIDKSQPSGRGPTVLRLTGGWVRDKLLKIESHDIDVSISNMTGAKFVETLRVFLIESGNASEYGVSQREVDRVPHVINANPEKSKQLETVSTRLSGLDIDFVNLRKETYATDSRTPHMEFGTPQEDAERRDATINALFYNLHEDKVEDLTGMGLPDLAARVIRTPLEPFQTFKDDPLRVLRLVRFASRYGFPLDKLTRECMADPEIKLAFKKKISRERVQAEIQKMLKAPIDINQNTGPAVGLRIIDGSDLFSTIFMSPKTSEDSAPVTENWHRVYDFVTALLRSQSSTLTSSTAPIPPPAYDYIRTTLLSGDDDQYSAWMLASLIPWTGSNLKTGSKTEKTPAAKAAREGLSESNAICKLVDSAFESGPSISKLWHDLRLPEHTSPYTEEDLSTMTRAQFGWIVRQWSSNWRLRLFAALLQDIYTLEDDKGIANVVEEYVKLTRLIFDLGLSDAWKLIPAAKGNEIMSHFGTGGGKWVQKATELTLKWQLERVERMNAGSELPAIRDQALEMLDQRRSELGI